MIKLLTGNPWVLLAITIAFVAWSTLIGVKAYNMGSNACEAAYLAAEQEQQRLEMEAASKVSKERQVVRKQINKSKRKIITDAKNDKDDKSSKRLQSISHGLYERWFEDHK